MCSWFYRLWVGLDYEENKFKDLREVLQNTSVNLCILLLIIIIMYFMLDFTATINYVRVDYKSILQRCWSQHEFCRCALLSNT